MEDVGPGGDWGCEGGLMNEIRVLITDPTELASCLCFSTPWKYKRTASNCKPGSRLAPDTGPAGLPASRTVRNHCLLFKPPPSMGICYSSRTDQDTGLAGHRWPRHPKVRVWNSAGGGSWGQDMKEEGWNKDSPQHCTSQCAPYPTAKGWTREKAAHQQEDICLRLGLGNEKQFCVSS